MDFSPKPELLFHLDNGFDNELDKQFHFQIVSFSNFQIIHYVYISYHQIKHMKVKFFALFILLLITNSCSERKNSSLLDEAISSDSRTVLLFDDNWLFFRGDAPGAESAEFVDSSWRLLDLPHDWSIGDIPGTSSPFDSTAVGGLDAGYLVGGTGWYRKKFMVPDDLNEKRFLLQFDGIYMNSDIWLNGHHLGNHPYGYTSFRYDLTDFLHSRKRKHYCCKSQK